MIKWLLFATLAGMIAAIPIDNGVEGEPEIECGPLSISVNINTQNEFNGHVYVKNRYAEPGCRSDEGGRRVAGITLPFNACGVSRTRSLNPKGVFVTTTIVVSFHPQFETKVDRAYRIQCFYMEADKTVSAELEVSMLTTGFQTQVVPMPVCRYEILSGGPTGTPVQYALVGDSVYHKWTCDSETVDTFCMVVHSCFVNDGNDDKVDLLTAEGCAIDKFLLNNLEYPTDLMAGQEAHVFKYADRAQLFFQCQITISIKEPNGQCERPTCTTPEGFGPAAQAPAAGAGAAGGAAASADSKPTEASAKPAAEKSAASTAAATTAAPKAAAEATSPAAPARRRQRQRQRRQANWESDNAGTVDVQSQYVNMLDIADNADVVPSTLSNQRRDPFAYRPIAVNPAGICVTPSVFAVMLAVVCVVMLGAIGGSAMLMIRRSDKSWESPS
uniref:ZP domain-containing protein n=1 Tax=Plectus sambesii TaxID=2011161 RepID=A0A914XTF6_9BILA